LCNRFCQGAPPLADKECNDDGCVKETEYKCMQIGNANYANTNYEREGGIDQAKDNNKIAKKELNRATDNQEARKNRAYNPFEYVEEDKIEDKVLCPDCKKQTWLGRDDGSLGGDSSLGSFILGANLRGQR
jgi:hypothetical protein